MKMFKDSPCRKCVDKRTAGCHDRCGAYKAWKDEFEHLKQLNKKPIKTYYKRGRHVKGFGTKLK